MYCPLKFQPMILDADGQLRTGQAQCEGNECAWWVNGECAIRAIVTALEMLELK